MADRTSLPARTWTIEEYTIGDLVSVRPYRGSFEPVGVAHGVTSHIEPLAAQAHPVRTREHRIEGDSRILDRPTLPVVVDLLNLSGATIEVGQ